MVPTEIEVYWEGHRIAGPFDVRPEGRRVVGFKPGALWVVERDAEGGERLVEYRWAPPARR